MPTRGTPQFLPDQVAGTTGRRRERDRIGDGPSWPLPLARWRAMRGSEAALRPVSVVGQPSAMVVDDDLEADLWMEHDYLRDVHGVSGCQCRLRHLWTSPRCVSSQPRTAPGTHVIFWSGSRCPPGHGRGGAGRRWCSPSMPAGGWLCQDEASGVDEPGDHTQGAERRNGGDQPGVPGEGLTAPIAARIVEHVLCRRQPRHHG